MLDKLIKQVKSQSAFKKVCIFFLAFAATLAVMGGNHDIIYGSNGKTAPEEALTVQNPASTQENGMNFAHVSGGQTEQEFADGLVFAAAKTTKLEEASTISSDKKDSSKADSKADSNVEDEEDADDEANADETGVKVKNAKTPATEAEESTETKKEKKVSDAEIIGFTYSKKIPMSRELQEFTFAKCEERGLEYELVLAIIWRESRFNENAVHVNANGTRDNGMMQINDINRKWLRDNYGITDLMDPYQNIDAGTAMLGRLTRIYGQHNALLAYQYGEGGMAKKLKQGITTSTAIETAYEQRDYYREII